MSGYIRNPETGRMIQVGGTAHKRLIQEGERKIYQRGGSTCNKPRLQVNHENNQELKDLSLINFESKKIPGPLKLYIRSGTTDEKVIDEVLKRDVYEKPSQGFILEAGELWFDLGGNIGTFALLALSRGCSVVVYEPEPDNLVILEKNLEMNFPPSKLEEKDQFWQIIDAAIVPRSGLSDKKQRADLYLSKGNNKYRHTLYPKRGRQTIKVPVLSFASEMDRMRPEGVKMDIEGAEIDILETTNSEDWRRWNTKKLVFEYSFDIDKSIPRFLAIIDKLREYFDFVYYTKVKEDELVYDYFPAATIVYCRMS